MQLTTLGLDYRSGACHTEPPYFCGLANQAGINRFRIMNKLAKEQATNKRWAFFSVSMRREPRGLFVEAAVFGDEALQIFGTEV